MTKPVCVVLGGSGFLGRRLCSALLRDGYTVRSVSRTGVPATKPEEWWADVEWFIGSVGPTIPRNAVEGADVLFHLASTTHPSTSNRDPVYDLQSNTVAMVQMLQSGTLSNIKKIVYVSSGGTVYGIPRAIPIDEGHGTDPICSYGIHKLACEKYLQLFHRLNAIDVTILRVSNIYGDPQGIERPFGAVEAFVHRALRDEEIEIWGDGSTTRDYIHVDDVAVSLLKALKHSGPSGLFNVGSGIGYTLNDIVRMIEVRLKKAIRVKYQPPRSFDVPINILNISKARFELGWKPELSLELSMDQYLSYSDD